ncbi:hypothetical protein ECH_0775 [Ehrlichia chaffeensis str. Arkansas]|uniref:Uncharacterized protein n=1 Tax=Ehrlichia chaffeensis (strain ATCC CRL-10679 / Arkansas) TaxID=205920 RepID=Q2GG60_EHRCR|nr:hypothetical protein ECH_0775 [Ehrlichia chaffeensis str. Arkansas]
MFCFSYVIVLNCDRNFVYDLFVKLDACFSS